MGVLNIIVTFGITDSIYGMVKGTWHDMTKNIEFKAIKFNDALDTPWTIFLTVSYMQGQNVYFLI